MRGYVVRVASLPDCQFCAHQGIKQTAKYDAKTKMGPWAFVCEEHFNRVCIGIGVGYGQLLIRTDTRIDGVLHDQHADTDHEQEKPLT